MEDDVIFVHDLVLATRTFQKPLGQQVFKSFTPASRDVADALLIPTTMNTNPFIPQPPYPHQQPPLPPGPPPPQPGGQPDYSAYWSQQPSGQPAYNTQWPGTGAQWPGAQSGQPVIPQPKPPAEQSALYANYGYGSHQKPHWQQHQQPHHYAQPPVPVVPPVAPQSAYNPYQTTTIGYPQQYLPQAAPPQPPTQPYRPPQAPQPPQPPQQPFYSQQQRPPIHMQHTSPQQLPPAKRQRFDNSQQASPIQRQPPPPIGPSGGSHGPARSQGMGGPSLSSNHLQPQGSFNGSTNRNGGIPSMGGGRGGNMSMSRGSRGGHMGSNRGTNANRGRGGSMYGGGSGGRGLAPSGGSMRGHQSRDRGGFTNFNRRGGGGSFNNNAHHHQGASFRGGHGGHSGRGGSGSSHGAHGGRSNRSDGHHQNRGPVNTSSMSGTGGPGKREENRRTLTDFKIVGLEIQNLMWKWGHIPLMVSIDDKKETVKDVALNDDGKHDSKVKVEDPGMDASVTSELDHGKIEKMSVLTNAAKDPPNSVSAFIAVSSGSAARMRIYFHTPHTADDARPIMPTTGYSDVRKGKRKKLDDDDADAEEEGRGPRPRPVTAESESRDGDSSITKPVPAELDAAAGRISAEPSVAETASEDWLMAAIGGDDDEDEDGDAETDVLEETQEAALDEGGEEIHDQDGEFELDELSELDMNQTDVPTNNDLIHTDAVNENVGDDLTDSGGQTIDNAPNEEAVTNGSDLIHGKTQLSTVAETADGVNIDGGDPSSGEPVEASGSVKAEIIMSNTSLENEESSETKELSGSTSTLNDKVGAADRTMDEEHLPEPPASPTSNTAFSGTSNGSATQADLPPKPVLSGSRQPSPNRISISYVGGTKRLVIDAEIVDNLKVFRAEGRIEVRMNVERSGNGFKGILLEILNDETKAYKPVQNISESLSSDPALPPFWRIDTSDKLTLAIYLDKERPLSEPKWVKTGDVQDWLKDMFGGRFWVAGEAVGWEKKIEVLNPDPAPTIQNVLESWSSNSPVGIPSERQRFLKTHMTEADNILEILLRLVRGERATPFSTGSSISTPSITGPLLAAMDPSSAHATQQTHVSLAVVAIVRVASEFADKVLGEGKGKIQVEERVGEIIRALPSHLLYKSLDGMFKEWRVEKKSGR